MKVGIFDSGLGGLTVLKYLLECKPNNDYIYIGDTKNMPFGNKTKEELSSISNSILNYFESQEVDLAIIACGTISSTIYGEIKDKYSFKILDIISPTIKYLNGSNYENIGVIGTVNTINSGVFNNVKCKQVFVKSLPKLASLIENDDPLKQEYIDKELEYFEDKNIDILVLGCTHYPLVDVNNYKTLNMAMPLIKEVSEGNTKSVNIYFTKINDKLCNNVKTIIGDYKVSLLNLE